MTVARKKSKATASKKKRAAKSAPSELFYPGGEKKERVVVEVPQLDFSGVADEDLRTYYVLTDKRGLALYEGQLKKSHHSGFRVAMLAYKDLEFNSSNVNLVGKGTLADWDHAVEWSKSNIVEDLHQEYLLAVGERRRPDKIIADLVKAKGQLAALDEKREAASVVIDTLSRELVTSTGKGAVFMEGSYWDASYSREKLFWKRRRRNKE